MHPIDICKSKVKHTLLSVEYEIAKKGFTQDYYECNICGFYHIFTVNKSLNSKRRTKNYLKYDKPTYIAKMSKKGRKRRKK